MLFLTGPPDESVKALEQAVRLNPQPPDMYFFALAASYRLAGRYQEALAYGKQFAGRHPDFHPIHFHCWASLKKHVQPGWRCYGSIPLLLWRHLNASGL